MWQSPCAVVSRSVAIILQQKTNSAGKPEVRVLGTAFLIANDPMPTFLTCAHVMLDGHQRPRGTCVVAFGNAAGGPVITEAVVDQVAPELDAMTFVARSSAAGSAVTFNPRPAAPMGAPVAVIGAPLPEAPTVYADGNSSLDIQLRLSAGWVSSSEAMVRLPDTLYTNPELRHYELNLHAFPGISGGPVFDSGGQVIGMVRGTRLAPGKVVAPYAYADRTSELLRFLTQRNRPFMVSANDA